MTETETETVTGSETVTGFTWSRWSSRTPAPGLRPPDSGRRTGSDTATDTVTDTGWIGPVTGVPAVLLLGNSEGRRFLPTFGGGMQEFLRRNFYFVYLAAIVVGSYLAAGVVTEFAATAILKAQGPSRGAAIARPTSVNVRPAPPESVVAIASGRNPFDAEPPVQPETEEEQETKGPDLADLGVNLLGVLVARRPEWTMALVQVQGQTQIVGIGSLILDRAEVVQIASRYLVVRMGEHQKVVKLWGEKVGPKPPGAMGPPRPFAMGDQPPPGLGGDAAKGVKKVGPYEYHIDRGMLDENLQDLTKLGMQARIIPNYVDGKYQGFRLVGIRPDSLYRAIGLESGDLVTRVNGQDIDTPNRAIQLFEELRNSPTITLDLERRGQKVTMTYKVK